jgi:DNA-binding IclR family transcriptional regulator
VIDDPRAFSKAVFGNQHRLRVLVAIAEGEASFYQREVAEATGIPDPTIAPILEKLVAVGLIRSIDRILLNGPKFYERQAHPIWQVAQELLSALPTRS